MKRRYPPIRTMSRTGSRSRRAVPAADAVPARARSSPQRPYLPPQSDVHHQVEFGGEICLARGRGLWMSADHKQATSRQRGQVPATSTERRRRRTLFRTTAFPTARLTTKPDPRRPAPRRGRGPAGGRSAAARPARLPPPHGERRNPHAAASGTLREARSDLRRQAGHAGQTLTRARPLRRRAARTARPALVRMRSRNPCVLARRRLFGWNVRLLTGDSRYGLLTRLGSRAARRASAQQTAQGKLAGSVHVTRTTEHRSNQRAPAATGCAIVPPAEDRLFAERDTAGA